MKIVIAPDSFKESLTALEVALAIETGFKQVFPHAEYYKIPMADGGEGTVQSLIDATNGKIINIKVRDPLGHNIESFFGLSGDGKTAFIEMAAASGLHLVPVKHRDPKITSSYGTGELILSALSHGVEHIILGIGGSATNDAGVGMLIALGVKFYDIDMKPISQGGAELARINHIDLSNLDTRLDAVKFEVACDVDNPLCGDFGASVIFGPQKGATKGDIKILDSALRRFAHQIYQQFNIDIANVPGSGAAGGMGAGVLAFLNAELKPGIEIVIKAVKLSDNLKDADLVITGEGRMDSQSIRGKTPIGVAKLAKQYGYPVIAIVGCLREDYEVVYDHGIDAVFPIIRQITLLEDALKDGQKNLISTAQNVARFYALKLR